MDIINIFSPPVKLVVLSEQIEHQKHDNIELLVLFIILNCELWGFMAGNKKAGGGVYDTTKVREAKGPGRTVISCDLCYIAAV